MGCRVGVDGVVGFVSPLTTAAAPRRGFRLRVCRAGRPRSSARRTPSRLATSPCASLYGVGGWVRLVAAGQQHGRCKNGTYVRTAQVLSMTLTPFLSCTSCTFMLLPNPNPRWCMQGLVTSWRSRVEHTLWRRVRAVFARGSTRLTERPHGAGPRGRQRVGAGHRRHHDKEGDCVLAVKKDLGCVATLPAPPASSE